MELNEEEHPNEEESRDVDEVCALGEGVGTSPNVEYMYSADEMDAQEAWEPDRDDG